MLNHNLLSGLVFTFIIQVLCVCEAVDVKMVVGLHNKAKYALIYREVVM